MTTGAKSSAAEGVRLPNPTSGGISQRHCRAGSRKPQMAKDREPLRIAFAIPYFYPALEFGGQPRSAYELGKALVRRGHRVKVLTTDSGGHSRLKQTAADGHSQIDGTDFVYYRTLFQRL